MNGFILFGASILASQVVGHLYSGTWFPVPLIYLTGSGPGDSWESWHGLHTVLTYIPCSGVLILWGLSQLAHRDFLDGMRRDAQQKEREIEEVRTRR